MLGFTVESHCSVAMNACGNTCIYNKLKKQTKKREGMHTLDPPLNFHIVNKKTEIYNITL